MTITNEVKTYLNYIDGKWVAASTNEVDVSLNPANQEEIVGRIQRSGKDDLDNAVAAAKKAAKAWRRLSGAERGEYLYKLANVLESRLDEIAMTMTKEMGKTFPESKVEVGRGVTILRFFAGEGVRKIGDVIPSNDSETLLFTTRIPLGVVGVITPWNFPVAIPIWKMAPALVYGNTIVLKPAQETAVTAAKIVECMEEAGIPAGVINLVTGGGAVIGQGIADHPDVDGITFTGSNQVGKMISRAAVERGAKFQLEMGGKAPVIVLNDANLDLAVDATIKGGFLSTGQKCTASTRVLVQSKIYDAFKAKLVEQTMALTVGNGLEAGTWMGPCANEKQMETVMSYMQKGIEEGASLLCGGARMDDGELEKGFYVQPTIFDEVTSDMTIAKEEIFGPVLALFKVETLDEALEIANDVQFGLSASIFTKDVGNILSFINEVEAGMIRINMESAGSDPQAPFGGLKDSSSHSREQGRAALEFFTSIKTVYLKA